MTGLEGPALFNSPLETGIRTLVILDAAYPRMMAHAATLQPGGPLGHHAGITVKQGFCHHFVNDEKLTWCKT